MSLVCGASALAAREDASMQLPQMRIFPGSAVFEGDAQWYAPGETRAEREDVTTQSELVPDHRSGRKGAEIANLRNEPASREETELDFFHRAVRLIHVGDGEKGRTANRRPIEHASESVAPDIWIVGKETIGVRPHRTSDRLGSALGNADWVLDGGGHRGRRC